AFAKHKILVIRIAFSKVFLLANADTSQICVAVSKWAGTDGSDAAHEDKTPPRSCDLSAHDGSVACGTLRPSTPSYGSCSAVVVNPRTGWGQPGSRPVDELHFRPGRG